MISRRDMLKFPLAVVAVSALSGLPLEKIAQEIERKGWPDLNQIYLTDQSVEWFSIDGGGFIRTFRDGGKLYVSEFNHGPVPVGPVSTEVIDYEWTEEPAE